MLRGDFAPGVYQPTLQSLQDLCFLFAEGLTSHDRDPLRHPAHIEYRLRLPFMLVNMAQTLQLQKNAAFYLKSVPAKRIKLQKGVGRISKQEQEQSNSFRLLKT